MIPTNSTVDKMSWIFNVLSILSKVSTFIMWVANKLTKIQSKMPKAIKVKGYIKLAM